jgi:hypothetical protein
MAATRAGKGNTMATETDRAQWVVVQVGPVCRVPGAARFGVRRRWWYVHQRSRLDGTTAATREVDPWSAHADPDWLAAQNEMHRRARALRMPWCAVRRDTHLPDNTVAYYLTREGAESQKAFDTDRVQLVDWGLPA